MLKIIITITIALGMAPQLMANMHHNHPNRPGYTRFANTMQSFPQMAALAIATYKKDLKGAAALVGISNLRTVSKPGLKGWFNKTRPCGCKGGSFPSGHTLLSFQGASFVHYRYGLDYAWPLYIVGGLVGFSRTKTKSHDWIDVAGSAFIANITTYFLVEPFGKDQKWTPQLENTEDGMRVKISFKV